MARGDNDEHALLARCYKRSLELAKQHSVRSIAFPAISCGAYRFPIDQAAKVAIDSVLEFCKSHDTCPSEIYLVCFDPKVKRAYERYAETLG